MQAFKVAYLLLLLNYLFIFSYSTYHIHFKTPSSTSAKTSLKRWHLVIFRLIVTAFIKKKNKVIKTYVIYYLKSNCYFQPVYESIT